MTVTRAPTAAGVEDAAGYVERLRQLRVWAGRPSFRRLAALAGTTTTPSGYVLDRLPPSTTSDVLSGKRLPQLPRMDLVEAFVTACMKACPVPQDVTRDVVEQWLVVWRRLAGLPSPEDSGELTSVVARRGDRPLVGRHDALDTFDRTLDDVGGGRSRFMAIAGEPGSGKTRLLTELAARAAGRDLPALWGRPGEFEQEMPLGGLVDALDDRLEGREEWVRDRLGTAPARLLASVFPSLSAIVADEPVSAEPDLSGLARYRVYRAVRRLLEELAASRGLVLLFDDVHWADEASVELLDHLLRHPARGRVLIVVAYRPAQVAPRLTALISSSARPDCLVPVRSLTRAETEEFLGPVVDRTRGRALYEASGGNPFYLEALAALGEAAASLGGDETIEETDGLPSAVRAALQVELLGLSPAAVLVAQGAAVVAAEFEPPAVAVAAQVGEDVVIAALDEMAARDLVRPAGPVGRFQFRHPLVRAVAYGSAAPGWRLAAHARISAYLARLGVPAATRAHHVARSGRFGDRAAIATLAEAARTVAPQAPATAVHWLRSALRLMGSGDPGLRLDLLTELARTQMVSGQLAESRVAAHEALRLVPRDDHVRRGHVVRICSMIERLLGRRDASRDLLLAELRQMPDPQAETTVPVRIRLTADSLFRSDFRAAQAFLDVLPETDESWEPLVRFAVAALRPMPAFAAGRIADAIRHIESADRLIATVEDEQIVEWLDPLIWLCWAELFMGRCHRALQHLDRLLTIARLTGQSSVLAMALAAQSHAYALLGRLTEGTLAGHEATEVAMPFGPGQLLVIAMAQECLIAGWAGDEEMALRRSAQAVRMAGDSGEWWGAFAWYARAVTLINLGRLDEGGDAMIRACDGFNRPRLDQLSLLCCCELMAYAETARGRSAQAALWADRAGRMAHPGLRMNLGFSDLARAHALRASAPVAAAEHARRAARTFADAGLHVHSGRARLFAGAAYADTGEPARAREHLERAARILTTCGARGLHAQVVRELRRIR
jgi:hypothetical protein